MFALRNILMPFITQHFYVCDFRHDVAKTFILVLFQSLYYQSVHPRDG